MRKIQSKPIDKERFEEGKVERVHHLIDHLKGFPKDASIRFQVFLDKNDVKDELRWCNFTLRDYTLVYFLGDVNEVDHIDLELHCETASEYGSSA